MDSSTIGSLSFFLSLSLSLSHSLSLSLTHTHILSLIPFSIFQIVAISCVGYFNVSFASIFDFVCMDTYVKYACT